MERRSKIFYDDIDIGNLFDTWHRDVREFRKNLNKDCVLKILKNTHYISFDIANYNKVLNFTNTQNCINTLNKVLVEKNTNNFFNILKERDNIFPRKIGRGFTVEEIYHSVLENNYHPIFFLELDKSYYIIDGRTRFYCCLFLNVPAKVRILSDKDINESCKK